MQQYLLTILIVVPLLGAVAALALAWLAPNRDGSHYRWIALAVTVVTFAVSLLLLGNGGPEIGGYTFVQDVEWIRPLHARYHLGVDGISLWLVLLTTLLMPIAVLSSWTAVEKRPLAYYVFLLILESAMIGVFVTLDLLAFYLFFEASLIPMFFLIGVWGGKDRIYAAVKFFIYTAVGSLLMLVGIVTLWFHFGTFDLIQILQAMQAGSPASWTPAIATLCFFAFAIAFCIKVPLFPFHTWLPDAHTEAPTAGSVILAGVLLKMGTYGLMRFNLPL
ncbi:MAG: NADH-quinone oxidoreductase subunit M, partial [Pyrinomonadaceae bacterium]